MVYLLILETRFQVAQVGLELTMQLGMILTSDSDPAFTFPVLGLKLCTAMLGFMKFWGLNPRLHACWVIILSTELHMPYRWLGFLDNTIQSTIVANDYNLSPANYPE